MTAQAQIKQELRYEDVKAICAGWILSTAPSSALD
jgi:hypothetical protein